MSSEKSCGSARQLHFYSVSEDWCQPNCCCEFGSKHLLLAALDPWAHRWWDLAPLLTVASANSLLKPGCSNTPIMCRFALPVSYCSSPEPLYRLASASNYYSISSGLHISSSIPEFSIFSLVFPALFCPIKNFMFKFADNLFSILSANWSGKYFLKFQKYHWHLRFDQLGLWCRGLGCGHCRG